MNRHYSRLILAVAFVIVAALGAWQGRRVTRLREAEAFYRWMLAAAVDERLFQDTSSEYLDRQLLETCNQLAATTPEEAELADAVTTGPITTLARDLKNDRAIWALARGDALRPARETFLRAAQEGKLQFARSVGYQEAQEGDVGLFSLFFGFRKVAANWLWIQVDRYWHRGDLYRMVALMKTCVLLDPNFIEAYQIGAWHMAYNATAKMADTPWALREWDERYQACVGEKERYYYFAIDFLKDGIRKNPRNYKLYFDLGFAIYKQKMNDYANAVKYLAEAVRLPHDRWVPRQLYICMELNGQYEEAIRGWEDYQARFPESELTKEVAPRFIRSNQGKLLEKQWEAALKRAEAARDTAEYPALKAEADRLYQQALEHWKAMGEDGDVRRMRLEALRLREEKRWLEAVALLDKARWDSPDQWENFSDLIIQIKQEGGIPLSLSERKAIERKKDEGHCPGMPGTLPVKTS
ncbi:MAG TPA: hypothetical protein PK349_03310 [Candidatus Hydrogenedentes bacterium]|nr:hypothetical protein [Candidatus Hydrogenedentota bacterium]